MSCDYEMKLHSKSFKRTWPWL